jgi:hypothetical protein
MSEEAVQRLSSLVRDRDLEVIYFFIFFLFFFYFLKGIYILPLFIGTDSVPDP